MARKSIPGHSKSNVRAFSGPGMVSANETVVSTVGLCGNETMVSMVHMYGCVDDCLSRNETMLSMPEGPQETRLSMDLAPNETRLPSHFVSNASLRSRTVSPNGMVVSMDAGTNETMLSREFGSKDALLSITVFPKEVEEVDTDSKRWRSKRETVSNGFRHCYRRTRNGLRLAPGIQNVRNS